MPYYVVHRLQAGLTVLASAGFATLPEAQTFVRRGRPAQAAIVLASSRERALVMSREVGPWLTTP